MPVRYVSAPRFFDTNPNDWQRDHIRHTSMTVIEGEPCRRDTGLLDARGNPIVTVIEMNPIGFGK